MTCAKETGKVWQWCFQTCAFGDPEAKGIVNEINE